MQLARVSRTAVLQTDFAPSIPYHRSCDVVGLCCLAEAKEGGDSLLVSAGQLYNALYDT
jgi:hypothetical protein